MYLVLLLAGQEVHTRYNKGWTEKRKQEKKKRERDAIKNKYGSAFWLDVTPFFSSTVTQQLQMYM